MSFLIYKMVFSKEIKGFNSVAGICNGLSAEELYRSFKRKYKGIDFSDVSIAMSDGMPYIDEQYYIPRPAAIIRGLRLLNITNQKALRTISYIELTNLENYFTGTYDYVEATKKNFGSFKKTEDGTFFTFAQDSGLYIIFNCNSGVVSNQFKSFLSQFILEQFNTDVYITEHSANDYLLNVIANEKTEYRISLSSIFTDVSDEILRSVCANASYIVTEKQLQGDSCKVCYLKSGAVITDTGIKLYDKNHQPCCISIGCRREE